MNTPRLTLIISFYNKIDLLRVVLESVALQTMHDFEVVIADDGSRPEVVNAIKALQGQYTFPLFHVWHEDKGWRKNSILNQAVVASHSEYLVFIDGDCVLEPHFLEEHYAARKRGEVVTGRRVLLTPKTTGYILSKPLTPHRLGISLFWRLLGETLLHRQKTQMEQMIRLPKWLRRLFIRERARFILGCNFSLYKDDLLRVNGFDERFVYPGYGEDIDLWLRLQRLGIRAMSRKGQLVQFHCYHQHFDTNYAPNKALMQENTDNHITFTPFGIRK